MKSLTKTLVLAGSLCASAVPFAFAQDNPPPPPPAAAPSDQAPAPEKRKGGGQGAKMLEQLKDKLSLTDDEVTQVQGIMKGLNEKRAAIRDDDSLSDDDKRAKMKDLQKEMRTQIRAILTPDQQAIFDKMPPMGGRPPKPKKSEDGDNSATPPPPPPPPPAPSS